MLIKEHNVNRINTTRIVPIQPSFDRFDTSEPEIEIEVLGTCPHCKQTVTDEYEHVEWDGEVFCEWDHLHEFIGAVEVG